MSTVMTLLGEVLPVTDLVHLVQHFDVAIYTSKILKTWTPASPDWPDVTRNADVTRHLLTHHLEGFLAPYLLTLLQRISIRLHGLAGCFALRVRKNRKTHVMVDLNFWRIWENTTNTVTIPTLEQIIRVLRIIQQEHLTRITHFFLEMISTHVETKDFIPWFTTCPIFGNLDETLECDYQW